MQSSIWSEYLYNHKYLETYLLSVRQIHNTYKWTFNKKNIIGFIGTGRITNVYFFIIL